MHSPHISSSLSFHNANQCTATRLRAKQPAQCGSPQCSSISFLFTSSSSAFKKKEDLSSSFDLIGSNSLIRSATSFRVPSFSFFFIFFFPFKEFRHCINNSWADMSDGKTHSESLLTINHLESRSELVWRVGLEHRSCTLRHGLQKDVESKFCAHTKKCACDQKSSPNTFRNCCYRVPVRSSELQSKCGTRNL